MQKLTFFNYKIQNNADTCDIYIDGIIVDASTQEIYKYWFDDSTPTSFKSLRNQISESAKTINVFINSGGGQVTEAMAIHDYLVNLQSKGVTVNTYGRGIIASAATYILMSSKNSTISKNSWFMIHNVQGGVWGDVNDVENYARTLRNFNDTVTAFYSNSTGLSETVIGNMMNKETWLNGDQALEKGFVKNVENNQTFTNAINQNQWLFNNTQVLQAYNSFTTKIPDNMDFKKIGDDLKNSIINHLKEIGVIKNETDTTKLDGITTAVENALKPINEEVDTKVKNAVEAATKDLGTTVTNVVTEVLKNLVTKDDLKNLATTQSVTDEVKKVTDELEEVKKDIANKKGGEAGKGKAGNQDDKSPFNHEGVTWGSDNEK